MQAHCTKYAACSKLHVKPIAACPSPTKVLPQHHSPAGRQQKQPRLESSACYGFGGQTSRSCSSADHFRVRCAARALHTAHVETQQQEQQNLLLDSYWQARGVFDAEQRAQLVAAAATAGSHGSIALSRDAPLPGVPTAWHPTEALPEVLEVSRRLLALQQLLGGSEAQAVVWMVTRYPALLTADFGTLTRRLFDMKVAAAGFGVDVIQVVQQQPALLLTDSWLPTAAERAANALASASAETDIRLTESDPVTGQAASNTHDNSNNSVPSSSESAWNLVDGGEVQVQNSNTQVNAGSANSDVSSNGGAHSQSGSSSQNSSFAAGTSYGRNSSTGSTSSSMGSRPVSSSRRGSDEMASEQQRVAALVQAWSFGLSHDEDPAWEARLRQLQQYRASHGDTSVGFRDEDDLELARWAQKQRHEHQRQELASWKVDGLQALGFEFDAEEAEWRRWFGQLASFVTQHGHCSPTPLVQGTDLFLMHWVAIQRIARRSRVLSQARIDSLTGLGFDWDGSDPLS